jgi:DNA-binding NarL/FixJ family response regulator
MRPQAENDAKTAAAPDHPSIFSRQEWREIQRRLKLSARQGQIVCLLLEGHKIYSVAMVLGISPDTVRAHLRRLYLKLGVSDRLDLVIRCFRESRHLCRPM